MKITDKRNVFQGLTQSNFSCIKLGSGSGESLSFSIDSWNSAEIQTFLLLSVDPIE